MPKNNKVSAIKLSNVAKKFDKIVAVDGLDLDVPFGKCIGLLGPNGAGKSTTMKMLTAQVIADKGTIEVLGYNLPENSKQARAEMGVVPQLDNLDTTLTVEQNLLVFSYLYRIAPKNRKAAIKRALEIANLQDRRDAKVDELSGGMRRRLLITRALLHEPRLVLLDEPTVGLDPQVRQELWALIDRLRSEGISILMSTHYIEEAERLCDSVTIMSKGKAIASGSPKSLIHKYAGKQAIEIYGPPTKLVEAEKKAQAKKYQTRRTGTSITVLNPKGKIDMKGETRTPNLEDVFVLLTGEEIS
jgi:lipooligosaccharide transport system ATP-binding protein